MEFSAKKGNFEALIIQTFSKVIDTIISKYLKSHKRLIIPQLGVFLVKSSDGSIVFSELMKQDDGILQDLLCREGRSAIEAEGEINRMVFEIRHDIGLNLNHSIEGVGTLCPGPNNTIAFRFDPEAKRPTEDEQQLRRAKAAAWQPPIKMQGTLGIQRPQYEAPQVVQTTTSESNFAPESEEPTPPKAPSEAHQSGLLNLNKIRQSAQQFRNAEQDDQTPRNEKRNEAKDTGNGSKALANEQEPTAPQDAASQGVAETDEDGISISSSAKMHPASYMRGLQYRRPHKSTDAYEFNQPKRPVDRFLIVGIIAALLAVGAIIFGFWVNSDSETFSENKSTIPQVVVDSLSTPSDTTQIL